MGRKTHNKNTQNIKIGSRIRIKTDSTLLNQIEEKEPSTIISNIEELADYKDVITNNSRTIGHLPNETEEVEMDDMLDVISEFVSLIKKVSNEYNKNNITVQSNDILISDIMHEIELGSPKDLGRAYKCYTKLRNARNVRRIAKNRNKFLNPLYEYIKQNSNFINDMINVQSKCAVNLYEIEHSTYTFKSCENIP